MMTRTSIWKTFVAASVMIVLNGPGLPLPAQAQSAAPQPRPQPQADAPQDDAVSRLLRELAKPDQPGWQQIEQSIAQEWARSGSASMDLLLNRGMQAMEAGEIEAAIEHFSALTDHAPGFAEGWNARATAFFQADMYGPALADIERVLALEPRHFGALTGLAIILEQVGYPEDAYRAWQAVAAIHPHRPEVTEALERLEREVAGQRL